MRVINRQTTGSGFLRRLATGLLITSAISTIASAEVIVSMPPPTGPQPRVIVAVPTSPTGGRPRLAAIDSGDIAIHRYSNARTGPYNVYYSGPWRAQGYSYTPDYFFWFGGLPSWYTGVGSSNDQWNWR